jgi:hypothetical protein
MGCGFWDPPPPPPPAQTNIKIKKILPATRLRGGQASSTQVFPSKYYTLHNLPPSLIFSQQVSNIANVVKFCRQQIIEGV